MYYFSLDPSSVTLVLLPEKDQYSFSNRADKVTIVPLKLEVASSIPHAFHHRCHNTTLHNQRRVLPRLSCYTFSPSNHQPPWLGSSSKSWCFSCCWPAKVFPGEGSDPVDVEALPELLEKATAVHDDQLRSAARGAAKVALALITAWYPDADIWQDTEFMPTEDEHGQPIVLSQVLADVQGYATRVANMVDIRRFYKEHPDPHVEGGDPSLADPEAG